jgi:hypothetical protein
MFDFPNCDRKAIKQELHQRSGICDAVFRETPLAGGRSPGYRLLHGNPALARSTPAFAGNGF